jgi:transcriptional regulator with XRE-family HTH domain
MKSRTEKVKLRAIGKRLLLLRQEKRLSLRQMAKTCGIDNSKIAKIEKGLVNVTYLTFLTLCEALDVAPCDFFNDELEKAIGFDESGNGE